MKRQLNPEFRVAARCSAGGCVAVAITAGAVLVRDSKAEDGPVLSFTHDEWNVFTEAVYGGEFSLTSAR